MIIRPLKFPLLTLVFVIVAGCTGMQRREEPMPSRHPSEPTPPPPVTSEAPRPHSGPYAAPRGQRPYGEAAPPARESSPAVLALLSEADRQLGSGQVDNAAATLERAIRIKPKSAELWHKMARLRLQQHQPGQAENLAKKSNVLARGDRDITRRNWSLIAEARRQKGDQQGAAEAEARAAR
jgi:tetratricopeptide (TPR) repeat protein